MTRIGKQQERRNRSPRRHRPPAVKTGPLKDALPEGYKPHANALEGEGNKIAYIAKVK